MREDGLAVRLASVLYDKAFLIYRPVYGAWKRYDDRLERDFIASVLKPGQTAIDVGANIGVYTDFLSKKVGATGAVLAFEPAPENYGHLRSALENRVGVTLHQAAVADESGQITLYLSDHMNVDHQSFDGGDGRQSVTVPKVSLDEAIAPNMSVDFIKIDVQGFEHAVLKGAKRVMAENPSLVILLEFWPYGMRRAGTDAETVVAYIRDCGYQITGVPGAHEFDLDQVLKLPESADSYWNVVLTKTSSK